jgi:hypothetical protein
MQSSLIGRVVLGIAVVAAAVVLLLALKDDDGGDNSNSGGGTPVAEQTSPKSGDGGKPPTEPAAPTIVVEGGRPVGGVEELVFSAGDRVRFSVRADGDDEVHLHGYDIEREVGPSRVARFDFPATIEGLFEAELHGSGEQIAELRIEP